MRGFPAFSLSVLTLVGVAVQPVRAQGVATRDISVGYSVLRDVTSGESISDWYRGWLVSAAYPFGWNRLSLMGEAGSNSRTTRSDEVQRISAFLGGARIALMRSSRLTTFAQVLAGIERFSEPGFHEWGVAFQPGAGVDVGVWSALGVRVQGDLRFAREGDFTYRELRLAVSAVFDLGR